jgi:RimJ/RimL family protein N-acetyltransferase
VPAESPTLGFTHLQFEALLTAARQSSNDCDFALVAMLGLLGLRIFEATGSDIEDLGEEHGHRVLRVCGKGTKIVLVPLPPAVSRAIVVGYCGVKAMRAHGQPVLNLIYRFRPSAWGRGYATEAAIAAVAWAEQHQPDFTILARVRPANKASQNVALKAGLRRDPAMDEQGEDGLDLAYTNRTGITE